MSTEKLKNQQDFFYRKLIKVFNLVFFNLVLSFNLRMLIKKQDAHTKNKKSVRFLLKKSSLRSSQ